MANKDLLFRYFTLSYNQAN